MALSSLWHERPYYSLDAYCKNTFGYKLHKLSLDAGFTCPNRDGTIGTRGCIFCSAGGSGDFALPLSAEASLPGLLDLASGQKADTIAYFQAYTNTYASPTRLEALYRKALDHSAVAGISIATRPDCLPEEVLSLLQRLHQEYTLDRSGKDAKFIWIELGLQTIHEQSAHYIRRGYPLCVFDKAIADCAAIGIPVIVHVILGLPFETKEDCFSTIHYLNTKNIFGVKLQLLHVLKGTDLYTDYEKGIFSVLSKEEYLEWLTGCVARLQEDIVIHRLTGDGPKELLAAPQWSLNKRDVLNSFHHKMKLEKIYQGLLSKNKITFSEMGLHNARHTDTL